MLLSIVLHRKLRALRAVSKNLSVSVFNKTFNVFNPYSEHRKTVTNHLELLLLFVTFGQLALIALVVLEIFELGLLLGFITSLLCISLLMVDEVLEVHKNAKILESAISSGVNLGKGDIDVVGLLEELLPKLSVYYFSLAIVFFAASLALPYVISPLLLAFAHFASLMLWSAALLTPVSRLTPFVVAALFTLIAVPTMLALNRAKNRIFGFPPSELMSSVEEQFRRIRLFAALMHHPTLRVPEPEKTRKADERNSES